jgi:hypothetical protein
MNDSRQRARNEAGVVNLEPVELSAVGARTGSRALRHVDQDRSFHMGPLAAMKC